LRQRAAWLHQGNTLAGKRQHINAVKAQLASGDERFVKVGRKCLVERGELLEKLREEVEPVKDPVAPNDNEEVEAFLNPHGLRISTDNE